MEPWISSKTTFLAFEGDFQPNTYFLCTGCASSSQQLVAMPYQSSILQDVREEHERGVYRAKKLLRVARGAELGDQCRELGKTTQLEQPGEDNL